jgi:hypothetical protein
MIQIVVFSSLLKGHWIAENYLNIVSLLFIQTLEKHGLFVGCLNEFLSILTSSGHSLLKRLMKFR